MLGKITQEYINELQDELAQLKAELAKQKASNKITFNTGYTLEFRPISRVKVAKINLQVQREFEERNEPLEPPKYYTIEPTKEHPEGLTQPHDETTLITDEDKLEWAKHQNAINRLIEEQSIRVSKYILSKGILTDIVPTQEWIDEEIALGTELPKSETDLMLEYLYDEILVSPENALKATLKPLELSREGAIDNLEVEAIEDTFPGNMESGQEAKDTDGINKVAEQ